MDTFLIGLISYIMGSIPFGFILTKIFLKKDIREIGSGNIGATNVLRTIGLFSALIVLVIDVYKGYFSVTLIPSFFLFDPFVFHYLLQICIL